MKSTILFTVLGAASASAESKSRTTPFTSVYNGKPFSGSPLMIDQYINHKLTCASSGNDNANGLKDGKLIGTIQENFKAERIIPVSKKNPDIAYKDNMYAKLTPGDLCAIFEIRLEKKKTKGKWCTTLFGMAHLSQLKMDNLYRYTGADERVASPFTWKVFQTDLRPKIGVTSWNNLPGTAYPLRNAPPGMRMGFTYTLSKSKCPLEMDDLGDEYYQSILMCSEESTYIFAQNNDRGCPLGFYVIVTDTEPNNDP